jgi:hypothetical protein
MYVGVNPISTPTTSSVECAGSDETNKVLYPCFEKFKAVAADVVDFPTPPFPVNKINLAIP